MPDRTWVSLMYSYPNYIPVNAPIVQRILSSLQPFAFGRIYGAFPEMTLVGDGKRVIEQSAVRYLKSIAPE